jgi:TonB family protein
MKAFFFIVAIGVTAVLLILFVVGLSATSSSSTDHASMPNENLGAQQQVHAANEAVNVGYWTYRCNGAAWRDVISTGFDVVRPDARFLVVDVSLVNNDKSESYRAPMKLIDGEGREFSESSESFELPNSLSALKSLNPSVATRGLVLFDIPPTGTYRLQVSGGFTSDEKVLIELPIKAAAIVGTNAPNPVQQKPTNFDDAEKTPEVPTSNNAVAVAFNRVVATRVNAVWQPNDVDLSTPVGSQAIVLFDISKDGRPDNVRIGKSSGSPTLDESGMKAVQRIQTFGALPEGIGGEVVSDTYTFTYQGHTEVSSLPNQGH